MSDQSVDIDLRDFRMWAAKHHKALLVLSLMAAMALVLAILEFGFFPAVGLFATGAVASLLR